MPWEGSKISAKCPVDGLFYACKVLKVNEEEQLIFIHYLNWNKKFDEWIMIDSDRLQLPVVVVEDCDTPVVSRGTKRRSDNSP